MVHSSDSKSEVLLPRDADVLKSVQEQGYLCEAPELMRVSLQRDNDFALLSTGRA